MSLRIPYLRLGRSREAVFVGLDLSPGRIKLVGLVAGQAGPLIVCAADEAVAVGGGDKRRFDAAEVGGAIADLLRRLGVRPRSIALALGPAEAVARRVAIVDQERQLMLAALSIQLGPVLGSDVTSPRVDFARVGAAIGNRVGVFGAAARTEAVEAQQRAVAAADGWQGPVTAAAAALVNAWRVCRPVEARERAVLLHIGESAALWIVMHGDDPIAADAPLVGVASALERSGGRAGSGGEPRLSPLALEEWTSRLKQEVLRAIQNARRESGSDGPVAEYQVWLSGGGVKVAGIVSGLQAALAQPVAVFDPVGTGLDRREGTGSEWFGPALAPAAGAALQALNASDEGRWAGGELLDLDLRAPISARPGAGERVPVRVVAKAVAGDLAFRALAVLGLVAAVVMTAAGRSMRSQLEKIEARESLVVRDSSVVAASLSRKLALDARRRSMGDRVDSARALEAGRYEWPRLLHAIPASLPPSAWVSDVLAGEAEGRGSGAAFRIRGYAASTGAAQGFARRLVTGRAAGSADVTRTGTVRMGRFPVVQFEIAGETPGPSASATEGKP